MPNIVVNRNTGEIEIEGDCGAQWEGSCSKIKVTKDKISLECDTELVEECEDMRKERAREINERAEVSSSGPMDVIPSKYKYFINYIDPEDEEGIRERYWYFIYLPSAEEFRDDLAEFWGDDPKSIEIQKVKHNPGGKSSGITSEKELQKHISLSLKDYVISMQEQVAEIEGQTLTAERLKEALDEDSHRSVDLSLAFKLLNKYGVESWE